MLSVVVVFTMFVTWFCVFVSSIVFSFGCGVFMVGVSLLLLFMGLLVVGGAFDGFVLFTLLVNLYVSFLFPLQVMD